MCLKVCFVLGSLQNQTIKLILIEQVCFLVFHCHANIGDSLQGFLQKSRWEIDTSGDRLGKSFIGFYSMRVAAFWLFDF